MKDIGDETSQLAGRLLTARLMRLVRAQGCSRTYKMTSQLSTEVEITDPPPHPPASASIEITDAIQYTTAFALDRCDTLLRQIQ